MINPKLLRIKRKTAGWKLYLEITCLSTMLTQDQIKAASSEKRIHILENLFIQHHLCSTKVVLDLRVDLFYLDIFYCFCC